MSLGVVDVCCIVVQVMDIEAQKNEMSIQEKPVPLMEMEAQRK